MIIKLIQKFVLHAPEASSQCPPPQCADCAMFGFGAKKKAPDELVKEWRKELRKEQRGLDRSLRSMETEERKARAEIKKLAKLGQTQNVRVVAQQLVRTKAAKEKIQFGKAQLGSVMMQMNNQLAMMKVSGCMQKSSEVLAAMTSAVKIPAINEAMRNMAREMERAGMIEEMVDDVFDIVDTVEEDAVELLAAKTVSNAQVLPERPHAKSCAFFGTFHLSIP